ncbi:amidase [Saccharothrix espanaensis]|uniref:Secreted amidase n=1 Tax=Saccharothrix espanaensis (strain ATCC 51144 / DSM 44229 / JCM 9112 / NBRC 15066 / NRRL 15764) TaxID=1179773 RepID=K0K2X7_SACES|nr:Secreted amidase [Saccharothrix espanaensis DSM 44229]
MRSTAARWSVRGVAVGLVAACAFTALPAQASTGVVPEALLGAVLDRVTVLDLQQGMDARVFTSEQVTRAYLRRIDTLNPRLNAVLGVNPDAVDLARQSDARRREHRSRGPLDGIPVLIKGNTDTADRQPTTAGSTALLEARPEKDAFLVSRLREAGAVILGKANLSIWSNFRGSDALAGWSATGGQTRNPYVLDRSPCGSSSGSAAAAAANLAAITIGTDTDGSIVCPAAMTSTVGVKPSLGLVSRTGVVPITSRHDSPGPITRSVTDAAVTLWALRGTDLADPDSPAAAGALPADYTQVLKTDALRGKRIGVWRKGHQGIDPDADRVFDASVAKLRDLGATVVEGADLPDFQEVVVPHLLPAVLTEFKHDLNAYLAATPGSHPKNLTGLIEYNRQHADVELATFGQDLFEMADKTDGDITNPEYRAHREAATAAGRQGIDDVLAAHRLDAIVTSTELPAPPVDYQGGDPVRNSFAGTSRHTSTAGYPHLSVPAGFSRDGLPLGLSFLGTRFSDAKLLSFAYAYEQATHARKAPRYLPTAK